MSAIRRAAAWILFAVLAAAPAACGGGGGVGGFDNLSSLVHIVTTSFPNAETGSPYSAAIEAEFPHPLGAGYVVVDGALPPGLSLGTLTGQITGIAEQVGSFDFTIMARDGPEPGAARDVSFAADRADYTIVVTQGPPHIAPQELPEGQYKGSYFHAIKAVGGSLPYAFQKTGGTLPAGVAVRADGAVFGVPTEFLPNGEAYTFEVTVTDAENRTASQTFSLVVRLLPLQIKTTSIPEGVVNLPYSAEIELSSFGGGGPFVWSQATPSSGETLLENLGMEITSGGFVRNSSSSLGPNAVGTFKFTARVEDGVQQVATRQFTLKVAAGPVLYSITPNKVAASYAATGLGFKSGAKLTFGPDLNSASRTFTPTYVSGTKLTFNSVPPTPAGGGGSTVSVRVRNPDGAFYDLANAFTYPAETLSFDAAPVFPVPNSPLSSAGLDVGDVNRDGFADIVHCGTVGGASWSAKFGNPSSVSTPAGTVWNYQPIVGTAGGIDVLVNQPNPVTGQFDPSNPTFVRVSLTTAGDWHAVRFCDVDSDGDLDVVAAGVPDSRTGIKIVRVYKNDGTATAFAPGQASIDSGLPYNGNTPEKVTTAQAITGNTVSSFDVGGHFSDIALGPLTQGDGVPDLVYSIQDTWWSATYKSPYYYDVGSSITAVQGLGTGSFPPSLIKRDLATWDVYAVASMALGDWNGDGRLDLAVSDQTTNYSSVTGYNSPNHNPGSVAFADATGAPGTFTSLVSLAPNRRGTEVLGIAAGDVNGDGKPDVVFAGSTDAREGGDTGGPLLTAFRGSGTGTFTEAPTSAPSIRCRYVVTFDGDGDLADDVAASGGVPGAYNQVIVCRSTPGTGALVRVQTLSIPASSGTAQNVGRIARGDFNGDGKVDVCVALSFYADARWRGGQGNAGHADRGNGGTLGVAIFLNTSR